MLGFSEWLAGTSASALVTNLLWVIPTFQTIHILALAILFTSIGAITLRSYGLLGAAATPAQTARRFTPWVWTALVVLLLTGSVLIVGEPVREFINWAFWIKVPLILVAAVATGAITSWLARSEGADPQTVAARARRGSAVLILLWALVVVFGRLIAYGQIT